MDITLVSPFDPVPETTDNGDAHTGGVERVLANLSHQLAHRGHDVTVLCSTDGHRVDRSRNGLEVVRVPRQGTLFRAPLVRLADHLPDAADLVHVPATYPFTTPTVLRRATEHGIPTVLDFHFEPHPGSRVARVAAHVYRRLAAHAYRLADRVLVRSLDYGRSAPSLAEIPEDRWRTLPNGIDPETFHPRPGAHGREHLLFVGRLVPYKGLEVLLDALAKRQDEIDLPLLVAGDGPLRDELEAKATRLDVDARFLGHVPDDALPDLYRDAAVTVLPSVNQQEAFGISLLESMACGTPVVASKLPGVETVAREGGLVAPPRDAGALADRLVAAAQPGTLPSGAPLARKIHRRYAWEAVADRLLAVYEEAAS